MRNGGTTYEEIKSGNWSIGACGRDCGRSVF